MARRIQTGKSRAGRLRIVAGNWRSRLLDIADVEGLRPTAERVRETLFNWLAPHLDGARCLDLFAGTGALGFEALSRGAGSCDFVERSPQAVRQLRANVDLLGACNATVVQDDALDFITRFSGMPYDVVFLDPPFAADLLAETCRLLVERGLVAPNTLVYLEQDAGKPPAELPPGWLALKNKKAGNVRYMLVRPLAQGA